MVQPLVGIFFGLLSRDLMYVHPSVRTGATSVSKRLQEELQARPIQMSTWRCMHVRALILAVTRAYKSIHVFLMVDVGIS